MRRSGRLRGRSDKLGNLVLGMSLFVALGCGQADAPADLTAPDLPKIRAFVAEAGTYHLETRAWGRLEPGMETRLSAQVAGVVSTVSDRLYAGNVVSAGYTLAELDSRDYRLALVQQRARLASAELRWHQERAEAEAAEIEWREQRSLRSPSTALPQDHELATRQPQLREAKAQLEAARAAVEKAHLDLARTKLKAPYSAWVTARLVEPGQFVRVGDPIAELQSTEFLEARLPVSSRHLEWIERNPTDVRVMLYPQDQPDSAPLATVLPERIEPRIDPETGLGHLVVRLRPKTRPNQDVPLDPLARAGALVAARIVLKQPRQGFWIPRTSLLDKSSVIVAREDGTLERRQVQIAADRDTWLAVDSGLQAGDRICHSPPPWASEGMSADTLKVGAEDLYALVGSHPPAPIGPEETDLDSALNAESLATEVQIEGDSAPSYDLSLGPTQSAAPEASRLTAWNVELGNDGETLRVYLSGEVIDSPKSFALERPHRWVVDMRHASWPHAPDVKSVDSGPFRRVRLAQFNHDPPIARLVVELDQMTSPPVIRVEPQKLEILFGASP